VPVNSRSRRASDVAQTWTDLAQVSDRNTRSGAGRASCIKRSHNSQAIGTGMPGVRAEPDRVRFVGVGRARQVSRLSARKRGIPALSGFIWRLAVSPGAHDLLPRLLASHSGV